MKTTAGITVNKLEGGEGEARYGAAVGNLTIWYLTCVNVLIHERLCPQLVPADLDDASNNQRLALPEGAS